MHRTTDPFFDAVIGLADPQYGIGQAVGEALCSPCEKCGEAKTVEHMTSGRTVAMCVPCEDIEGARIDGAREAARYSEVADLEEKGFSRE